MGEAFPELRRAPKEVAQIIRDEEEDFLKVIDRGLGLFSDAADRARKAGGAFGGEDIFELHTTYGFPPDMTIQLARDEGFEPDVADYEQRFKAFQDKSRGAEKVSLAALDFDNLPETDDSAKYDCSNNLARLVGWVQGDRVISTGALREGEEAALLFDRTCFYAEQGGQVGDTGLVRSDTGEFEVADTQRLGSRVLHRGRLTAGTLQAGQQVELHVNNRRRAIMANHTATHLLNLALREVLGDHVEQRGSLVDEAKTRFDFSHNRALDAGEIDRVERRVNTLIQENLPVRDKVVPLSQAKNIPGVRAIFGEKYPDPVRVIYVCPEELEAGGGEMYSIEFCGGTHVARTGDIGFFKITGEEAVAKGVRRVTGITGEEALEYVQRLEGHVQRIAQTLGASVEEAPARIEALREEVKALKKKLASGGGAVDPSSAAARLLDSAETVGGVKLVVGEISGASDEQLRAAADAIKAKAASFAAMLASVEDEKVMFVAAVSDDVIKRGLKAGDWVRETAAIAGGGGGGRPNLAQAGGKHPEKVTEALDKAREVAKAALA